MVILTDSPVCLKLRIKRGVLLALFKVERSLHYESTPTKELDPARLHFEQPVTIVIWPG